MGNDISGFADPDYLPAAADAGATVVATHIRLASAGPRPRTGLRRRRRGRSPRSSSTRAGRPRPPVSRPTGSCSTPGSTSARPPTQSLTLLRASDRLAALGYPLLLSASNKTFLGKVLDLEIDERREASLAATAIGVALGCRIVRVHEVGAHRQVCRVLAAISEASAREPVPPTTMTRSAEVGDSAVSASRDGTRRGTSTPSTW